MGGFVDELKRCPFCGSRAEMFCGVVTCRGCRASVQRDGTHTGATAAWNRRARSERNAELLAALEALADALGEAWPGLENLEPLATARAAIAKAKGAAQ